MENMQWCVEVERLPLPRFPLTEAEPEGSIWFWPKMVESEQAALTVARRFVRQVPSITINGPNGIKWDQAEILRRLVG
jgi:hypothetical protein